MPNLYIIFTPCINGMPLMKEPGVLLVAGSEAPKSSVGEHVFSYSTPHLQAVYRKIHHLFCTQSQQTFDAGPVSVSVEPGLLNSMMLLGNADNGIMLHLVLAYCLTVDKGRCSALLRSLIASDTDFFEFVHRHRLEPWPVNRYAETVGLSLRKFNELFKDKFGMSAKLWLHHQRLEHARQLLESTPKKVIDVAIESGFCNPAHFSFSFRRHFRMSPSEARRESLRTFFPSR